MSLAHGSRGGGAGVSFRRLFTVHGVAPRLVKFALLASFAAMMLGYVQGWPPWVAAVAALLPWAPILYGEVVWTHRHYSWLALFYVLVVSQVGHFFEHVAQMIQIHFLGLRDLAALGVFGTLNIEWVHFVFNTWVIIAVPLVLYRFRTNPWLWVALIVSAWHELEHLFIMATYLSTGKPGTPGLLATGGAIGGGLPLKRADLHFLYNLVETVPLVVAFIYQLNRTCDDGRGDGGRG